MEENAVLVDLIRSPTWLQPVSLIQREIRYGARVAHTTVPKSKWDSSGHLRRCSDADTSNKCLSRAKDASILSWPTIMGHLHSDTSNKCLSRVKDASREIRYGARVVLAEVPNWDSSGHLRCCSDADTSKKCLSYETDASILSWPTIMGL
eukprot:scaffold13604_cov171-Skeletonema_dohrnii-CCMP3373.AAC.1